MGKLAQLAQQQNNIVLEPSNIQAVPLIDDSGVTVMLRPEDAPLFIQGSGNVTQSELAAFFVKCATWRVNPYKNEAYIIKYGSQPATIVIAEKVYEQRVDRMPDYLGMTYGVIYTDKDGDEHKRKGKRVNRRAGEQIVGAFAEVLRKGRNPTYTEIDFDEYAQYHKDRQTGQMVLNSTWANKPGTMITKCVKAAALRDAYPDAFSGMYVQEEIDSDKPVEAAVEPVVEQPAHRITNAVSDASTVTETVPVSTWESDSLGGEITAEAEEVSEPEIATENPPEDATDEQMTAINELVAHLADLRGVKNVKVMQSLLDSKALSDAGYDGSGSVNYAQAEVAIKLLNSWAEKAEAADGEKQ